MPQEQSQIMLPLVNTDLDFSLGKNLSVCAVSIQSNHEDIFFMIVEDSTAIKI